MLLHNFVTNNRHLVVVESRFSSVCASLEAAFFPANISQQLRVRIISHFPQHISSCFTCCFSTITFLSLLSFKTTNITARCGFHLICYEPEFRRQLCIPSCLCLKNGVGLNAVKLNAGLGAPRGRTVIHMFKTEGGGLLLL